MSRQACDIKQTGRGHHVVDGAGVRINRIIPSGDIDHIDPFVLLDEIKSDDPEDYIAGFPTHPHRGIETITYMLKGNFRHKDSRGGGGLLSAGCVQWMTAGKGIQHSEMPENDNGSLWGFQLWLSLLRKDKMVEPRYQHLSPDDIPEVKKEGLTLKIISGSYDGVQGPAENWVKTAYFDVRLKEGAVFSYELEEGMRSFCYLHTGALIINPAGENSGEAATHELVEFTDGSSIELKGGPGGAGFLYLAAFPNNEPIVRGGPFVMNTEEEISQAFEDYHNGVLF